MRGRYIFILLAVALLASACGSKDREEVPVVRLDQVLASLAHADSAAVADTIAPLRQDVDAMFSVLGMPDPSVSTVCEWCRSRVVSVFQPDVDAVYSDTHDLELMVGGIMANANADSLGLPPLRFVTVVWGSMRPIVRVDSIVLIALNHYLGSDYEGYSGFTAAKRFEKTSSMLPYDLSASLAATQYPMHTRTAPTLLNWMLYEGALVEARMRLVDQPSLALAVGIDEDQLAMLNTNSKAIWHEMAAMRLIYDTDPMTIDRYLTTAPSTPLLGGKAPGRVGRYVGYRILRSWLRHNGDRPLSWLLSPAFYDDPAILAQSRFDGK